MPHRNAPASVPLCPDGGGTLRPANTGTHMCPHHCHSKAQQVIRTCRRSPMPTIAASSPPSCVCVTHCAGPHLHTAQPPTCRPPHPALPRAMLRTVLAPSYTPPSPPPAHRPASHLHTTQHPTCRRPAVSTMTASTPRRRASATPALAMSTGLACGARTGGQGVSV